MIAWVGYQRRADAMSSHWKYEEVYISKYFKNKWLKPIDYFFKIAKTFSELIKKKPDIVWMQLPPTFMIHVIIIYKLFFNKQLVTIVDFHNSALRPKWFNFPTVQLMFRKIDIIVAHNQYVKNELIHKGFADNKVVVLEDKPFDYQCSYKGETHSNFNSILFPCSFDIDEPIDVVLNAARITPEIKFFITGNYKDKLKDEFLDNKPDNVEFTGFLTKSEFEKLFFDSSAILGLTTRDNVQLSVANEALSAAKPMVLSNTKTLKKLFDHAAVFVDSLDENSISEGCLYAVSNMETLSHKTKELKDLRTIRWLDQAEIISKKINSLKMI